MPVNLAAAAATYARNQVSGAQIPGAQATPGGPGLGPRGGGSDFASLVSDAASGAIDQLRAGENKTLAAAAGSADINQVVMAVSKADITLQTVVAVRDRVVQAYQDILRMPI